MNLHFNVARFMNNTSDELLQNVMNKLKGCDFKVNAIQSTRMKLHFLKTLKTEVGCPSVDDIEPKHVMDLDNQAKFLKQYKAVFRITNPDLNFTTNETTKSCLVQMYRQIFPSIIKSRRLQKGTRKDRVRRTIQEINTKKLDYHSELYQYRAPKELKPLPNLFKPKAKVSNEQKKEEISALQNSLWPESKAIEPQIDEEDIDIEIDDNSIDDDDSIHEPLFTE